MRVWKIVLIVAVVGSGFWTGYLWRNWQKPSTSPGSAGMLVQGSVAVSAPSNPPGFDANLVLPPPDPDMKGVTLDPAMFMISDHFKGAAGLKSTTNEPPMVERPSPTMIFPVQANAPVPQLDGVPAAFPRTFRIPAPAEEPVDDALDLRQQASWLYTNKRDLRLNFDVARAGPSGIRAVELWARYRDTDEPPLSNLRLVGRGADDDRLARVYKCVDRMEGDKSPFVTHLWGEGTYQFRLVFENGVGVRSRAPAAEDLPDLYVCLDTTKPTVEMLPPLAEAPGLIKLRWKAEDRNFGDTPIRAEFSVDGKTWRSVSSTEEWLPNTGEYLWNTSKDLPAELHLRIVARDKAGNLGESRSATKVPIDLTVPHGRISGFVEQLPAPRETSGDTSKTVPKCWDLSERHESFLKAVEPLPRCIFTFYFGYFN